MIEIDVQVIIQATAVFLRVTGVMFALPFFGDRSTPLIARILASVALTFGLHSMPLDQPAVGIPDSIYAMAWIVLKELVIGLGFGLLAKMFFEGFILAAEQVGYQMGFGTASLMIADADAPMNGFTAFHRILTLLIFLALDLHHLYFQALGTSLRLIPVGGASLKEGFFTVLLQESSQIFAIGVTLAAPVVIALLFTMAALGLIARAVPQFNVFVLSFPISFIIGLLVYIAALPFFPEWILARFTTASSDWLNALQSML